MEDLLEWPSVHTYILQLEQQGKVTRTFRRLDPDRQLAVLNAILDEATEKGPAAINIKQVAERAGVAVGSLYAYFGNREGLLDFAIELCVHLMNDSFSAYKEYLASLPLREGLSSYLVGGVEWGRTQMGLVRFFVRAAYQGDPLLEERLIRPIGETLRSMVQAMLAAAVARGEIRDDVDLEATARVIHAMTAFIGDSQLLPYLNVYSQVTDETIPAERTLKAMLDLVMQGVGK